MKLLLTFLLTWVVTQGQVFGQDCTYSVSGRVVDRSTGAPLAFANVKVDGILKGAITDTTGNFVIEDLCEEEFHLVVSMVGYKTVVHHHDAYHPNPTIFLAGDELLLESITVEEQYIDSKFLSLKTENLTKKQLERSQKQSLGDLASEISGVSTISTGQNVVKPIIHGLHSSRILIINNELRHEFQNWGIEHAPEIDASSVESLEVVKGAAAVRYGPDALGGVIRVKSATPLLHETFYGNVHSQFFTNGRGTQNSIQVGSGGERIGVLAGFNLWNSGDLSSADYVLTNTGKKEWSGNLHMVYHGKKWDLDGQVSRTYQKLGILRSSITGNLFDLVNAIEAEEPAIIDPFSTEIRPPFQEVDHFLAKIKGTYRKEGNQLTLLYGYQSNARKEIDLRRGSSTLTPSINLLLNTHTADVIYEPRMSGEWLLSLGGQGLIQGNDNIPGTNTVPFVPNFNNYRLGGFAILALNKKKITWEVGLRYDYQYSSIRGRLPNNDIYRHKLNFGNLTGSVGFVKKLNASQTISYNLGTAWRPPNILELYSFGKHQNSIQYGLWRYDWQEDGTLTAGGVVAQNNLNPKSELGIKNILSWNYNRSLVDLEVGAYAQWLENFIFTRPAGITNTVRGAFPYFIFDQTRAWISGMDVDLWIQHSQQIESTLSGSFLYARDLRNDTYFPEMPPLTIRYQVELMLPSRRDNRYSFGISNRWISRQWMSPMVISPEEILDSYIAQDDMITRTTPTFDVMMAPEGILITDAFFDARWRSFRANMKVSNVLNQSYRLYTDRLRYFADQTGINLMIKVSYQW